MGLLHQVLRVSSYEGQVRPLVLRQHEVVNQTSHEHSGEERYEDTDDPGRSEALHRTCTEVEQDDTCDQRREVRVEDSAEGVGITLVQSLFHTQTLLQLFLDTLIDQHVSIHSSTQCQHDTCDTRHGQGSLERGEDTQCEEQVEQQGDIREDTRDEAIQHDHVDHQQHEGHNERDDTLLDRLSTQ